MKQQVAAGSRDFAILTSQAVEELRQAGWKVDYVELRNRVDLAPPKPGDRELVVLGAGWLGKTRLIDNVEIEG